MDQRYDVDSRQAGTTNLGTWRVLLGFEGKNEMRWQSVINKTACDIEPGNSPLKALSVNVVKCQPNWWIIGGPTRTVHLPATTISVYVPSGIADLNTPTDQAIADWNAALAGTGVSMQRVSAPCGTGGDCVNVVEDTVASGCAKADPGVPNSSGEAQTPGTITFPPGWNTRPADRNRRSMAHELGHLLGLHHTTCSANDSIMAPVTSCTSTSGMTLSPKPSDILPTSSSTYGNQNQKTCGF
ncbi:MAG: hypothetical protein H0T05_03005 [Acidobacteria bacterium]|nr:hypothetical protein [Acidobacteriota bacterium]